VLPARLPTVNAEEYRAAKDLALSGVPLFMAPPDPAARLGYRLPVQWERGARPDPGLVDALPEGWALCAVMGHGLDLVDLDPRNSDGAVLPALPPALAVARTPSGGEHRFVLSLGLPSLDGVAPGLDYKGGDPTGGGRGFAFIAPTVRLSKMDGRLRPYVWQQKPDPEMIMKGREWLAVNAGEPSPLRAAILARREQRATGQARVVPQSVASREWRSAVERLEVDVRRWAASGWGGEAHAGLLAHTTHLARLSPEHAEVAYRNSFARAGVEPDEADLAKLESALAGAVPDVVVPDDQMSPADLFWSGGAPLVAGVEPRPFVPEVEGEVAPSGPAFEYCDPAWLEHPPAPPEPAYGAFGGPTALFYAEGVHWLQGESESGKTWVALGLVIEVLRAGGRAMVVDHEDTRDGLLARLRDLGILPEELGRLVYASGQDVAHAELAAHLADTDRDYALVVVDGVTSALSAAGLSGRDEQEVTRWADAVPRRARMAVVVDHVVKAPDERNGMAIGSQAKKSVVTGTSFEVRCTSRFGRGTVGQVELRLQKDKRGGVRGRARAVTRLRFASDPVTGAVTLSAAAGSASPVDGAFPGQALNAEAQVKIKALVEAWHGDPRSNPSQSQRVLFARARELEYAGDDRVMRAAYREFVAGVVPMNPVPDPDAEA
jgi:hypothetical protein